MELSAGAPLEDEELDEDELEDDELEEELEELLDGSGVAGVSPGNGKAPPAAGAPEAEGGVAGLAAPEGASGGAGVSPGKGKAVDGLTGGVAGFASPGNGNWSAVAGGRAGSAGWVQGAFLVGWQGAVVSGGGGGVY